VLLMLLSACNEGNQSDKISANTTDSSHSCMATPARFGGIDSSSIPATGNLSVDGMVLIPGGRFEMGGNNEQASRDEFPRHTVLVDSFYMDITEVTNAQFRAF